MYTDIKVREVPAVPTKSSDLQEYLDTESTLNTSIYSESINPSDFTRNRMKGGGNDPQYLGPVYTMASSLPEIYQDPAEVTSENITEKTKLGDGQFGEVVLANTRGLSLKSMGLSKTDNNPNVSVTVAVKKLQSNPSQTQREAFEKEAQFMSHIKHPNVLRLLGVCVHDSAFIMMEYTEGGDLNQFLQSYSEIVTTSSSQTQITSSELVYIASQIASGMQYLASLKFVHRDLATRNCFIGANTIVKVGDLGIDITRYKSHYYPIHGNTLLPIRWMATECFKGTFSEKSDVWAFGVTMWELFTLAKKVPHPSLRDEEVVHNTLKGEDCQFLPKPEACPQPVFEIMERCWAVATKPRASFDEVHRLIQTCL
jgi:serine/threonine protein kinase